MKKNMMKKTKHTDKCTNCFHPFYFPPLYCLLNIYVRTDVRGKNRPIQCKNTYIHKKSKTYTHFIYLDDRKTHGVTIKCQTKLSFLECNLYISFFVFVCPYSQSIWIHIFVFHEQTKYLYLHLHPPIQHLKVYFIDNKVLKESSKYHYSKYVIFSLFQRNE